MNVQDCRPKCIESDACRSPSEIWLLQGFPMMSRLLDPPLLTDSEGIAQIDSHIHLGSQCFGVRWHSIFGECLFRC